MLSGMITLSVLSPVSYTHLMTRDFLNGNYIQAGKEQVAIKPLIDSLFVEVNPVPVKAALNMMRMCNLEYRLPMCPPSNKTQYMVYDALEEFGLI